MIKDNITLNNRFLLMLGEFKSDQIFVVKRNSQTICMQKIRLEMTVYSQILLQSYS